MSYRGAAARWARGDVELCVRGEHRENGAGHRVAVGGVEHMFTHAQLSAGGRSVARCCALGPEDTWRGEINRWIYIYIYIYVCIYIYINIYICSHTRSSRPEGAVLLAAAPLGLRIHGEAQ